MKSVLLLLVLPLLMLTAIGMILRSGGLGGLDSLAAKGIVGCILLFCLWDPLTALLLNLVVWLGRLIGATVLVVVILLGIRWISRNI